MMNWRGFGRNQSWHSPGETEENHEKPVRIAGLQSEI
jgi:hypothetical protein